MVLPVPRAMCLRGQRAPQVFQGSIVLAQVGAAWHPAWFCADFAVIGKSQAYLPRHWECWSVRSLATSQSDFLILPTGLCSRPRLSWRGLCAPPALILIL